MRVLVTGASGYLGRFIVDELAGAFDLTLASRSPLEPAGRGVWLPCDVRDPDALTRAAEGQDAIVHAAALVAGRDGKPVSDYLGITVGGTWNVFAAAVANSVGRVVHISSVLAGGWPPADLGRPAGPAERFAPMTGQFEYGLAKSLAEAVSDTYALAHPGLAIVNLRPGVVIDAADGDASVLEDGRFPSWRVDPRDVAEAVRRCLESDPAPRGTYNVVAAVADAKFSWWETSHDLGIEARRGATRE